MMRRLYLRIAFAVALAAFAGLVVSALLMPFVSGMVVVERPGALLLSQGLEGLAEEFNAVPETEWHERLAAVQRTIALPLVVVDVDALPPSAARIVSRDRPVVSRPGASPPSVYLPLRGGSHYLVAGPLPAPPLAPFLIGAALFAFVLTVTASALVGFPLVRRLQRFRTAIHQLGRGNWEVRLDAAGETPLRDLAESINRTAAQLQQQFEEREALLQAVSHEIGTPLSRMRFQVELLEDERLAADRRARLRALTEDLDELDELSSELVSWIDSEARMHSRQEFEVRPVLQSLIDLASQAGNRTAVVTLDAPDGLWLRADQRQFGRAIENLLGNALRYAQECVSMQAREHGQHLIIDVRDDGPGIPVEQWSRVLEPFVRLDDVRSRAHRGMGLGLAIVKRIVAAHGGRVEIMSAGDSGTQVRTLWPIAFPVHPNASSHLDTVHPLTSAKG